MKTPTLRETARLLDGILNGEGPRSEGFILLRFSHGTIRKPEFVSTCSEEDIIRILKLALAQLEGRLEGEAGHA
jgi:hypothetical protein